MRDSMDNICGYGGNHLLYRLGPSRTLHHDTPSAPAPLNYGQETADTLKAQVAEAPALYQANATYSPQYTALDLTNLETALNGQPGQQGLLSQYSNSILPTLTGAQDTARATQAGSTVNLLGSLGPQATAAFDAANPGGSALQQQLTKSASQQLALGTQLDPNQLNQINQNVNANWSNRGLGTSAPAQLDAALQQFGGGQNLLAQRQQTASGVSNQDYSQTLAPLQALLGQPVTSVNTASGLTGQAAGLIGQVPDLNPESSTASSMASANMNAQAASNIAGANMTDSLIGGGISAL